MVCFLTINVNGIRQRRTRWTIFNQIRKLNVDICFLQETHIMQTGVDSWRREWGGDL